MESIYLIAFLCLLMVALMNIPGLPD